MSAVAAANSSLLPDSEFVLPKLVVNAFFRGKLEETLQRPFRTSSFDDDEVGWSGAGTTRT